MRRGLLAAIVLTTMLALVGLNPKPILATTGPYTLPFFDPDVYKTQGYGCTDRIDEWWWKGTNQDGIVYKCNDDGLHFHAGIDYGNFVASGPKLDIAASSDGVVVDVERNVTVNACGGAPTLGNYVIILHDSTHLTIYYHLKHGSITVDLDDNVSSGQKVGKAGNTGNSCGVHLHYALMRYSSNNPPPQNTYKPGGKWTTDPGRVPWRGIYAGEKTSGTVSICYGDTVTHWVEFQNIGGATWRQTNDANGQGRMILVSTTSTGDATQSSQFQASDWESSYTVTTADQTSVGLYGIGRFTFGLKGIGVEGSSYVNYFNLKASLLRWFDYDEIGNYYIPIFIVDHQAC